MHGLGPVLIARKLVGGHGYRGVGEQMRRACSRALPLSGHRQAGLPQRRDRGHAQASRNAPQAGATRRGPHAVRLRPGVRAPRKGAPRLAWQPIRGSQGTSRRKPIPPCSLLRTPLRSATLSKAATRAGDGLNQNVRPEGGFALRARERADGQSRRRSSRNQAHCGQLKSIAVRQAGSAEFACAARAGLRGSSVA